MFLKNHLKVSFLLAGAILLNSCALTNYTVEREYSPQLNNLENTKAFSIFTKVNYTPVFDNDVKAVGVKKGGLNNETAKIYLNEEGATWISNAFQNELTKAGYLVNDKNAKKQVDVTLNVKQFFVEPWVGWWSATLYSILSIDAKVTVRGDKVYYTRKFVSYDERTTIIWPDGMFEDQLLNVAQKALPGIIKEINMLLTNKAGDFK